MNRYSKVVLLLLFVVLISTGCSSDPNAQIDPNNGIWDKYFVYPLSLTLDFFADLFFGNYGLSIIVTTILLRFLVLPLMIKQIKSNKAMQELQPEIKEIKEKYKDNSQKINEETMKLFQKHNVNPLSGCLPLLVQMPILIAFYHAIMRNPHIKESTFLYLQLGQPDPYYILPILAAITTYYSTKTMNTGVAASPQAAQQQKLMTYLMPAMILFFSIQFASALTLYWITGNLFTIAQNKLIRGRK